MQKHLLPLAAILWIGTSNNPAISQEPQTTLAPVVAKAGDDGLKVQVSLRQKNLPWVWGKKPAELTVKEIKSPFNAMIEADAKQKVSPDGITLNLILTNESEQVATISNPLDGAFIALDDGKQRIENPLAYRLPNDSINPKHSGKLIMHFKLNKAERNGVLITEEEWSARAFRVPPKGKLLFSISTTPIWPETEWKKINPFTEPAGSTRAMELPPPTQPAKPILLAAAKYEVSFKFIDQTETHLTVFGVGPTYEPDFIFVELVGETKSAAPKVNDPLQPRVQNAEALPRAEDDPTAVIATAIPRVEVEKAAPDFTVADLNGKVWKLSELKGKKNLLLTFFPKCFTGGCANHLSSLRDQKDAFDAADTQILAVSIDPAEGTRGQKAFAQQWLLKFPLIPDTQRKLSMLYGAAQNEKQLAARMSILIDENGIVRWINTNVKVETHGLDVLIKLRELGLLR